LLKVQDAAWQLLGHVSRTEEGVAVILQHDWRFLLDVMLGRCISLQCSAPHTSPAAAAAVVAVAAVSADAAGEHCSSVSTAAVRLSERAACEHCVQYS
jgi:hypothetical protein